MADMLDMCLEEAHSMLGVPRSQSWRITRCSSCQDGREVGKHHSRGNGGGLGAGAGRGEKRIAHCITGAVRTLTQPRVHESIKRNLIESLGGNADVFMFLENGDTSPKGGFAGPLPEAEIHAVADYLGAVMLEFQQEDMTFLRCQRAVRACKHMYTYARSTALVRTAPVPVLCVCLRFSRSGTGQRSPSHSRVC